MGRERELEQLRVALSAVRGGPGRLVTIAGEPGVGKTRLFQEFLPQCRDDGVRVLAVTALPYTRATGHHTGTDLIRSCFGVDPAEGPEISRLKVLAVLRTLGADTEEHLAPMLWQLGVLEEASPFWHLDASVRLRRAVFSNFAVIERGSRQQPFVIAIENMHWADSALDDGLKRFWNAPHCAAHPTVLQLQRNWTPWSRSVTRFLSSRAWLEPVPSPGPSRYWNSEQIFDLGSYPFHGGLRRQERAPL